MFVYFLFRALKTRRESQIYLYIHIIFLTQAVGGGWEELTYRSAQGVDTRRYDQL